MLDLQLSGGIARLTLDRPEARNAVPPKGWRPIAVLAEQAFADGARLVVLSGRGGAFCAGADLGEFAQLRGDPDALRGFREAMRDTFDRLAQLPIPIVASIDGACFGAGVALAMACDMRIAAPTARFGITPAKLGIAYPQGDVHRLMSLVGRGQAARLLFSAATVDAAEAHRIGLVDVVTEDGGGAMCNAIIANSAASLAALKRGIALAAAGTDQDAEQDARFDALVAGEEMAARLEALRNGR